MTLGLKNVRLRKSENVATTQFLFGFIEKN